MRTMHGVVAGVALVAMVGSASAQEAGDVGVVMAYPGAVGVIWHISERIAIRPDVSIIRNVVESETTTNLGFAGLGSLSSSSRVEGWGNSIGLSALLTVRSIDQLRVYVTPRLAYTRTTAESSGNTGTTLGGFTQDASGFTASGAFGAQLGLHDRLALFGEIGVQHVVTKSTADLSNSRSTSDSTTTGLRSAVGLTFYF